MRVVPVLLACLALVGCDGGGADEAPRDRSPAATTAATPGETETPAAPDPLPPSTATRNTTRIAGADPTADAAGAALAAFPSLEPAERPRAVALVDAANWPAAISAAQLLADPVRAPVLLVDGATLPPATQAALDRLGPTGLRRARGAEVLRVATDARPETYAEAALAGTQPAAVAAAIDRLHAAAAGGPGGAVVVASQDEPGYAMPAASWAAKSGDPVLWVTRDAVPRATRRRIVARGRPRIYVLGPERVVPDAVTARLRRLGRVRRIAGEGPVETAVAFARYTDGTFGWGVTDPGHGLAFASTARPADAVAAAPFATSGSYAPLLLLEDPDVLPAAVREYLLDIQPGYAGDPVRGVYNHGWLMGGESAISSAVQARIDTLLEIQPVRPTTE